MENWLIKLSEEDRNFIKKFVMASGSLKKLAKQYDVSYPTLRIRLDKLINKIKIIEDVEIKDSFKQKIKLLVAEGELSIYTAKDILKEYKKSKKEDLKWTMHGLTQCCMAGLEGALVGVLASKGKAKKFIFTFHFSLIGISLLLLISGIIALVSKQP